MTPAPRMRITACARDRKNVGEFIYRVKQEDAEGETLWLSSKLVPRDVLNHWWDPRTITKTPIKREESEAPLGVLRSARDPSSPSSTSSLSSLSSSRRYSVKAKKEESPASSVSGRSVKREADVPTSPRVNKRRLVRAKAESPEKPDIERRTSARRMPKLSPSHSPEPTLEGIDEKQAVRDEVEASPTVKQLTADQSKWAARFTESPRPGVFNVFEINHTRAQLSLNPFPLGGELYHRDDLGGVRIVAFQNVGSEAWPFPCCRFTTNSNLNLLSADAQSITLLLGRSTAAKYQASGSDALSLFTCQGEKGGEKWEDRGAGKIVWCGFAEDGEFARASPEAQDHAIHVFNTYGGKGGYSRWGFPAVEASRRKETIRQILLSNRDADGDRLTVIFAVLSHLENLISIKSDPHLLLPSQSAAEWIDNRRRRRRQNSDALKPLKSQGKGKGKE